MLKDELFNSALYACSATLNLIKQMIMLVNQCMIEMYVIYAQNKLLLIFHEVSKLHRNEELVSQYN